MPPLWAALSNSSSNDYYNYNDNGIEISTIMEIITNGTSSEWWIPGTTSTITTTTTMNTITITMIIDIVFPDAKSLERSEERIFIYPGGQSAYNSKIMLELVLQDVNLYQYPFDQHAIIITYYPNNYNVTFLSQELENAQGNPGPVDIAVKLPTWNYISTTYSYSNITNINMGFSLEQSSITVVLTVSRQSIGLILRYALPMFLMSFLATAMFWAQTKDRANNTVTILLALATFSIVVNNNIPQVGYLTIFDTYNISIFVIITFCVVLHVMACQLRGSPEKIKLWPLRRLYVAIGEHFGRTVLMPVVILLYLVLFKRLNNISFNVLTIIGFIIFIPVYCYSSIYMETCSLIRCLRKVVIQIDDKFRSEQLISTFEIITINLYYYHKFSLDARVHKEYLRKKDNELALELSNFQLAKITSISE